MTKLIYGLVFAGCVLYAQNPASAPAPPPMVHMNVVALDSHNQSVGDLTADDFQITDQNKPQKIVSFTRVETSAPPPLAPHEFSNRAATGGRTTVVLFDLLNQARTNGLDAAHKLGHGLAQLSSGESLYFYILGLDGNLYPIHPFPEPGAPAAADNKTWTQQADAQIQSMMKTVNRARKAGMTNEDFTKKTYVALETLAKDLTAFPGARNIIWVTDGVPYVFPAKYQDTGCQGDWFGDCALYLPHLSVRLAGSNTEVFPLTYTMSPDTNTSRDMEFFAGSTGARSFSGIDLGEVLTQIGNEDKNEYAIAYQPAGDNWDQKFHKIKVSSAKGLKIQTKTRYFAVPIAYADQTVPKAAPSKDEDSAMLAALENPRDTPDIGLRVAVSPAPAGKKAVHLVININAADVQLHEQAGAFTGQIAIMFADFTPKGLLGVTDPKDFTLKMNAEQRAKVLKDGISLPMDQPVEDTVNSVRLVVYDHANNAYGSLTVPVTMAEPPPAK